MAAKTYNQILTKGTQSSLASTAIEDGKLRFVTDTGRLYLDHKDGDTNKRIKISDVEDTMTEEQILNIIAPLPKIYISTDTRRAFVSNGLGMIDLAAINLTLAELKDIDKPLWFGDTDDENPLYSADLSYNTSTKELKATNVVATTVKVGSMKITDSLNDDNTHTINFSF